MMLNPNESYTLKKDRLTARVRFARYCDGVPADSTELLQLLEDYSTVLLDFSNCECMISDWLLVVKRVLNKSRELGKEGQIGILKISKNNLKSAFYMGLEELFLSFPHSIAEDPFFEVRNQ